MADQIIGEASMEEIDFGIISAAGMSRSLSFEALKAAKDGDFGRADELLAQAEGQGLSAHNMQTDLLTAFASGKDVPVDVLLVHAQDHLMTSILARELICEIVELRRELASSNKANNE